MKTELKELIKKNFKKFVLSAEGKEGIMVDDVFLDFDNPNLQERILFSLGPLDVICNNVKTEQEFISFENPTLDKKSDVIFLTESLKAFDGQKKVLAIFENKIVSSLSKDKFEEQFNQVLQEVVQKYLLTYFRNSRLLTVLGENENMGLERPVVHLSLLFYNPEVYLQGKEKLSSYLDACTQEKKDAVKMLRSKGFFAYTITLTKADVRDIYQKYTVGNFVNIAKYLRSKQVNFADKESFVFPMLTKFVGFHQYLTSDMTASSISSLCHLDSLRGLPTHNIDVDSSLNNVRTVSQEQVEENYEKFIDTFCKNYLNFKKHQNFTEVQNGTGAKARELSFVVAKTVLAENITHAKEKSWQDNMNDTIIMVSCDMALIDGQHTTQAIIDLIDMLKGQKDTFIPQEKLQKTYKKVLKSHGLLEDSEKVKSFILNIQAIHINIKGFISPDLAKTNAKNQNDISQQSKEEKYSDHFKFQIAVMANPYNENNPYGNKIDYTKSAASMPSFADIYKDYRHIKFPIVATAANIFQIGEEIGKHNYFSSNYSSTSVLPVWKRGIKMLIKSDDFSNILNDIHGCLLPEGVELVEISDICAMAEKTNSILEKALTASKYDRNQKTVLKLLSNSLKSILAHSEDMEQNKQFIVNHLNEFKKDLEENLTEYSPIRHEVVAFLADFICLFQENFSQEVLRSIFKNDKTYEKYGIVYLFSLLKEHYSPTSEASPELMGQIVRELSDPERKQGLFNRVEEHLKNNLIAKYGAEEIHKKVGIGSNYKKTQAENEMIKIMYDPVFIRNLMS